MAKISLLHATRARVKQALHVWPEWIALASGKHEIEYLVAIDDDDAESLAAPWPDCAKVVHGPNRSHVDALNRALYVSTGDILVQVHDDLAPPANWDAIIAERIGDTSLPCLLETDDGLSANGGRRLLTVLIGTRAYFKKCGYFFHPGYAHLFPDDDHTAKAEREGLIVDARDALFRHVWAGSDHDEVARRNYSQKNWNEGKQLFEQREAAGFPDCPELWGYC